MFSHRAGHKSSVLSLLPLTVIILGLVIAALSFGAHPAQASSTAPHVDVMQLNSEIDPASLRYLTSSIDTAENDGATALVVEIDTPGGDIESMNQMYEAELNSTVPIIAYVSPSGAQAASAGAFVTLAAQVAIMAPTTRIGASSPVTSTGGDIGSTLKAKIENDLEQLMTSVQTLYHRNVNPALLMITQAKSYNDSAAESQYIVDCASPYNDQEIQQKKLPCTGAGSLSDLLNMINGRVVVLHSGRSVILNTQRIAVQNLSPSIVDTLYSLLIDPNIVFLLFIVAVVGIFVEISHPGAIVPGVTGGIALILFLFGAGSLSPNWAGLALMALAFLLLVLDVKLTTHGVLTIGAVVSLVVGALLFFNSGGPYSGPQVNPIIVYAMGGLVGLVGLYVVTLIIRIKRRPVSTGTEGMIGNTAVAVTPLLPEGRVNYEGEDWAAVLDPPAISVDPGSEVRIVAVEGLRLHVKPVVHTLNNPTPTYIQGS
ncbi:MAG TPA: nodulation protein NfeD [Ktedonobacteraceae bacterium]|jgi:membrane-bound serine protease (ClpP class)|nr:nodulation protein NfeD [Ktedonobacteraceae bacterium]